MHRYIAFLRGMNLGRRRIKNAELVAAFEEIGFHDVAPFLASGNVAFSTKSRSEAAVRARVEKGLSAALGYDVPTFLRSASDIAAIVTHEPFSADEIADRTGKLQVALLHDEPSAAVRAEVLRHATADDLLAILGRELYWHPRAGLTDSDLDWKPITVLLGSMTVRTLRTLERLAARELPGG